MTDQIIPGSPRASDDCEERAEGDVPDALAPPAEQRAAYRMYVESCDADRAAQSPEDGFPVLLFEPSARTRELETAAGDYLAGRRAADDELVSSADSAEIPRLEPPAGAAEGFAAGWSDRMREELPMGWIWTDASNEVLCAEIGEALQPIGERRRGLVYVSARGMSYEELEERLSRAGAKVWSYEPMGDV